MCVAVLAALVARMPKFIPASQPDPPTKPVLALEFPADGEVRRLLASKDAIETATANTNWDSWFIAGYTLLFISFALSHAWPLRLVMIGFALATAAFDLWENEIIGRFIAKPENAVDADVWLPAKLKWFCFFLGVVFVATLFARLGRWWWLAVILIAAPGVIGMVASIAGRRVLIGPVTGAAILAILVAALLLPFVLREHP